MLVGYLDRHRLLELLPRLLGRDNLRNAKRHYLVLHTHHHGLRSFVTIIGSLFCTGCNKGIYMGHQLFKPLNLTLKCIELSAPFHHLLSSSHTLGLRAEWTHLEVALRHHKYTESSGQSVANVLRIDKLLQ